MKPFDKAPTETKQERIARARQLLAEFQPSKSHTVRAAVSLLIDHEPASRLRARPLPHDRLQPLDVSVATTKARRNTPWRL